MNTIQIYPERLCEEYARGYEDGYGAGVKGEQEYQQGYEDGWRDAENAAFYRGVQHCYWFFYKLFSRK